ncbi:DUF2214 family protein [Luteimonas sp. A482]
MLPDFLLASLHHLLFFGLIVMLAVQSALLSRPIDAAVMKRLAGIDRGYGLTAVLLLFAGGARLFFGVKGSAYYLHNPWFHAKLGVFVLVAALSLWPTLAFLRWRLQLRADAAWLPAPAQVAHLRTIVRIEFALIAVILVLAAGMARHGGLSF